MQGQSPCKAPVSSEAKQKPGSLPRTEAGGLAFGARKRRTRPEGPPGTPKPTGERAGTEPRPYREVRRSRMDGRLIAAPTGSRLPTRCALEGETPSVWPEASQLPPRGEPRGWPRPVSAQEVGEAGRRGRRPLQLAAEGQLHAHRDAAGEEGHRVHIIRHQSSGDAAL